MVNFMQALWSIHFENFNPSLTSFLAHGKFKLPGQFFRSEEDSFENIISKLSITLFVNWLQLMILIETF